MTNFKWFIQRVRAIGGVWASESVFFSQTRDGYSAAYKPSYPESSKNDMIINDIRNSGAYLRGNYELIKMENGKFQPFYFDQISDIR